MLFEVLEDGLTQYWVSVDCWVDYEIKKPRHAQASCIIARFFTTGQSIQILPLYVSTDDESIEELEVYPNRVSFTLRFNTVDAPLRFLATTGEVFSYRKFRKAHVVGLSQGDLDKTKIIKIEWRQVPSITLPYSTIK
jgi:hypothetical protein